MAAGAVVAASVTWAGDGIGMALERVFGVNLRSWEFATIQVALLNVPGGAVVALLGALGKQWARGLVVGAGIHAILFGGLVTLADSFRAAPAGVKGWVLAVGVLGGGAAAGVGAVLARAATRGGEPPGG